MASYGAGDATAAAAGTAWAGYGAGDRRYGPDAAERESRKQQVTRAVCLSMLCGVCQQVVTLQSEPQLVQQLCGGDAADAARLLGNTAGLIGALGLMVNQAGSKLSDSLGRKVFFLACPATTVVAQALIARFSGSKQVVLSCRVVKGLVTAFLSTVMATTALTDVMSGQELAMALSKVTAAVGLGVSATSMVEGAVLARTRNDLRAPYLAAAGLGLAQLFFNAVCLPETLDGVRQKALDLQVLVESINPFAFVQIYTRGSAALQRMATVIALQMSIEGRNINDLNLLWVRNALNWGANETKNFVTIYGVSSCVSGMAITPRLLKSLSVFRFTSTTNLANALGFLLRGCATKSWLFYLSVVTLLPGGNGSSATALTALANSHAEAEGIGRSEFVAWSSSLRGLVGAVAPVLFGNCHAWAQRRGLPAGSAFALAAAAGALLPELLLRSMREADLRQPGAPPRPALRF